MSLFEDDTATLDVPAEEGTHNVEGYAVEVSELDLRELVIEETPVYETNDIEQVSDGIVEVRHEWIEGDELDLDGTPFDLSGVETVGDAVVANLVYVGDE